MKNPLVSIIIPAYNAELYLNETLESVRAQTYQNYEIILVDDESSDSTAAIAQSWDKVRYYRQSHQGSGPARNWGCSLAKGQLLSFIDADDLWSPDKLQRQVELFETLPLTHEPTLIYAHARQFFSPDLDEESRKRITLPEEAQPAYIAGTLLVTPAHFQAVGAFAPILGHCIDWHLRAVDLGAQIHLLPEVMLFRRIHANNTSRTQTDRKVHYVHTLKATLDRRRKTK